MFASCFSASIDGHKIGVGQESLGEDGMSEVFLRQAKREKNYPLMREIFLAPPTHRFLCWK